MERDQTLDEFVPASDPNFLAKLARTALRLVALPDSAPDYTSGHYHREHFHPPVQPLDAQVESATL